MVVRYELFLSALSYWELGEWGFISGSASELCDLDNPRPLWACFLICKMRIISLPLDTGAAFCLEYGCQRETLLTVGIEVRCWEPWKRTLRLRLQCRLYPELSEGPWPSLALCVPSQLPCHLKCSTRCESTSHNHRRNKLYSPTTVMGTEACARHWAGPCEAGAKGTVERALIWNQTLQSCRPRSGAENTCDQGQVPAALQFLVSLGCEMGLVALTSWCKD